mgnify:CR=1 FL=1
MLLRFSSVMTWCRFSQGSDNRSALAVDDLPTVSWASPLSRIVNRCIHKSVMKMNDLLGGHAYLTKFSVGGEIFN